MKSILGSDGKPEYAHGDSATTTVHGQTTFHDWYNDVSGTNQRLDITSPLTAYPSDSTLMGVQRPSLLPDRRVGLVQSAMPESEWAEHHGTTEIHTKAAQAGSLRA